MRFGTVRRLLLYGVTMAVGTALDVACQTTVRDIPGVPLVVAVMAGFSANLTSGYLMSRYIVFQARQTDLVRSSVRYALLVGLNVFLGIVGVTALVAEGWPYVGARLAASVVLVPTNYVVLRTWVFSAAQCT